MTSKESLEFRTSTVETNKPASRSKVSPEYMSFRRIAELGLSKFYTEPQLRFYTPDGEATRKTPRKSVSNSGASQVRTGRRH